MRVMGNPRDALGKSMLTSLAKLFKRKIVRIDIRTDVHLLKNLLGKKQEHGAVVPPQSDR
jgi:hypothetical protein